MAEITSFTSDRIQAIEDAEIVSANVDGSGNLTLTRKDDGVIEGGSISSTPPGSLIMFAGDAIPSGWLLCNGQLVSRSDYLALFTAIGTAYGEGDGSSTFALPDLQYRFPRGTSGGQLGFEGGSDSHVHTIADHAHVVTDHTHTITNHDHNLVGGSVGAKAHISIAAIAAPNIFSERIDTNVSWTPTQKGDAWTGGSDAATTYGTKVSGRTAMATTTPATAAPTTSANGSDADSTVTLPPYLNLNFIIKT
jgi:microcystin-dependent protein